MSIHSFRNSASNDIFSLVFSKKARALLPAYLHKIAYMRLLKLEAAYTLEDLRIFPSYRLEKLKGNRDGQYSIRINSQYRICFEFCDHDAFNVEIVDYH